LVLPELDAYRHIGLQGSCRLRFGNNVTLSLMVILRLS
jgi:hypothetical protein